MYVQFVKLLLLFGVKCLYGDRYVIFYNVLFGCHIVTFCSRFPSICLCRRRLYSDFAVVLRPICCPRPSGARTQHQRNIPGKCGRTCDLSVGHYICTRVFEYFVHNFRVPITQVVNKYSNPLETFVLEIFAIKVFIRIFY